MPLLPPSDAPPPSPELFQTVINDDRRADPFKNPPVFSADGRKPRVKSNLKKKFKNKKFKSKSNSGGGKKHGNRVPKVNKDNIRFVDPGINDLKENVRNNNIGNRGSSGPEVRPDGRRPRVKSNLRAKGKGKKKKSGRPVVTTANPFSFDFNPSTQRPLPSSTSPPSVPEFFQNFLSSTPQSPFSNSISPDYDYNDSPIVSNVNLEVEEDDYYDDGTNGFVSSTRPPFVSSTRRPFVSSTRRPFVSTTQSPSRPSFPNSGPTNRFTSKRPKVKSDLLAAQRQRDKNRNRFTNPFRFNNEDPRTSFNNQLGNQEQQNAFFGTTERPRAHIRPQIPVKTSLPDDVFEYVDEIDEFVAPAPTTTTTRKPARVKTRVKPRVKSNILARKRNRNKKTKGRKRVKSNHTKKVKFTDNRLNSIEDNTCDNPFKCPPTKTAARPDGRRPRVKSDIKARRRNYYRPGIRKTNRIRGQPKKHKNRFRSNGNQLRTRLKTRRGKSQRQKAFTKTPTSTSPRPFQNEFIIDDKKNNNFFPTSTENSNRFFPTSTENSNRFFPTSTESSNQFFPTSTESVLSLLLHQIEVENENDYEDLPQSNSIELPPPIAPPPRPSPRPLVTQIPIQKSLFSGGPVIRFPNENRDSHSFPSFPTVETDDYDESFVEVPQTRFPPRNRPSPVTHSAPRTSTVPSIQSGSSSSFFRNPPSTFSGDTSLQTRPRPSQNSFNLPVSSPTQSSFFPTISQPLSVFVSNNEDYNDPITSDYVFDYDAEELISEPVVSTPVSTTERLTTTRRPQRIQPTRFSFNNADLDGTNSRAPRVKSNILQAIRNKGRRKKFREGFKTNLRFLNTNSNNNLGSNLDNKQSLDNDFKNIVERSTISSVQPPELNNVQAPELNNKEIRGKINVIFSADSQIDAKPSVRPDGRKPRVKSDIRAKHAKKGKSLTKHKVAIDPFNDSGNQNIRVGKSVVSFEDNVNILDYDTEPEVRPDGQKPHVKSNILAAAKLKATRKSTSDGLKGHNSFKHSRKVITTRRPKFLQSLLFINGRENDDTSLDLDNSSSEEKTERALQVHKTTTPPSTTTTVGSISTSTTPTVITTTLKGQTQSPFGSTVPSILGAFLNTLNTRAIDPTLSSQLQDANGQRNSKNFQR